MLIHASFQDWIRGRIPYFARPPQTAEPSTKVASSEPVTKSATASEGPELEKTRRIVAVDQPLHQVIHTSKFLAEDEEDDKPAEEDTTEQEGEEWSGISADAPEADVADESMTWEQLMDLHDEPEPKAAEGEDDEDVDVSLDDEDDDIDIVLDNSEDEAPRKSSKAAAQSKLKRGVYIWVECC